MKPRITLCITAAGTVELLLNEAGRDLIVDALRCLDQNHDHVHLDAFGEEIQLSTKAYRVDDEVFQSVKILLRTDEWDRQYFPDVMDDTAP